MRQLIGTVAMLGAWACGSDPDIVAVGCTEEARPAIVVEVRSAATGAPAADGATLTLRDGDFVEVKNQALQGLTMFGATERPGTYDVMVERVGFQVWTRDRVVVEMTEDGCHVITVTLQAQLESA